MYVIHLALFLSVDILRELKLA